MSVQTRADQCLQDAKDHIEDASECLFEAIKSNTWGSDEFSDDYRIKMQNALIKILKIQQLLK